MRAWRWVTLVVILALAPAVAPAVDQSPSEHGAGWLEARSEHFVFVSGLGEAETRRLARALELLRAAVGEATPLRLGAGAPTVVHLFPSDRAFAPYKRRYRGEPAAIGGAYTRHPDLETIALDAGSASAEGVLYHEYVHFLLAHNLPGLPLWLEEGLAELFESFEVDGGEMRLGLPVPRHLLWLRTHPLLPLGELVEVDRESSLYNERNRKGAFYAASWALVHYLVIGEPENRPRLERYLESVLGGAGSRAAFEAAFTGGVATVGRRLAAYVQRPSLAHGRRPIELDLEPEVAVRPLARAEASTRLGDLLLYQDPSRVAEAAEEYAAALAAHPDYGPALSGLAMVAEARARWDEARELHRRAVATAPDDPIVVFRSGRFLVARGSAFERGVAALERATGLDPRLGPAWAALASALLARPEVDERSLDAGERAHELLPTRTDVTLTLLELYLRSGRREAAGRLAAGALPFSSRALGQARASLARFDLDQAQRTLLAGAVDEAQEILDRAERELGDALANGRPAERLAELRDEVTAARLVARYDAARAMLEAGRTGAARAALLEVAREAGPGALAEAARGLVERLDHPAPAAPAPSARASGLGAEALRRLNDLLARQALDQALGLLDELADQATTNQRPWLEHKRVEVRRAIRHNRFVGPYNVAVDLFNAGHHEAAARRLEALLAGGLEAEDEAAARRLLAKAGGAGR